MNALAYIVGNAQYVAEKDRLLNAVNDANAIADKLMSLGFTILKRTDCTQEIFERGLLEFSEKLENYDVGLFYFSGHGLQIDGRNYLTMTNSSFVDATSAKYTSFSLDEVIERMQKKNIHIKILILDACRNNPLPERGPNPGLAPVYAPKGTIIAFSTSPGETAMDYGAGENSIYTGAILRHINDKNIPIEDFFKRVRTSVYELSNGKQTSWEHTSLIGNFFFNSGQLLHSKNLPYRPDCVADMNFTSTGTDIDEIIEQLRSHDWYKQNPAIQKLRYIRLNDIDESSQFLLGRNLLQTADGNEFSAVDIFKRLGNWLERWSTIDGENHVLNGILYEIYFNSKGKFRRNCIKSGLIDNVLELEENAKFVKSFNFINHQLEPFFDYICYIPSPNPKSLPIDLRMEIDESDYFGRKIKRWILKSVSVNGKNIIRETNDEFSYTTMSMDNLKEYLKLQIGVPTSKMTISSNYDQQIANNIIVPIGKIVEV